MQHVLQLRNTLGRLALLAGALLIALGGAAQAQAWKPQKPVEFVIMAGAGGGADRLARFIQSVVQKHNLAAQPFVPVNKGGGSGAEALRYLKDKSGDDHIIMATLNSYYTTPLQTDLGVNIEEFTPVARLAIDTFILWVNEDSDVHDLNAFVKSVAGSSGRWKMGGTGRNQEDELITNMLEQEFKVKFTYIPFQGGGEVAKNLVGKHVDSTVNNPSEASGFYRAKKVRPIAALTPERLAAYPDVPTMRELGHDLVYAMQRSVVGPPKMSKEAQAYYTEVFRKVNETPEWIEYTKRDELDRAFLTGDELQKYFVQEREAHRKLLVAMGAIK
jgi:putative tricarboxylic transport membrane protein